MKSFVALLFSMIALGCAGESDVRALRVANWGGAGSDSEFDRLVRDLYEEFEAQNPGVRVRVENNPEAYAAKMVLSFVAKAEPDIMMLDASSAALFINNGVLADLEPLIANDPTFRKDDFFPNVMDIARRGSSLFAIPQDFTPMVMYYNKRIFDRLGVAYPKAGWTIEQFRETAKRLTRDGETHGFVVKNWMPGWVMWIWNFGGDVVSPDGSSASGYFDGPSAVKAVQFLHDLVHVDKSAPTLSQVASMGVDPFVNGKAAMTISGHWSMIEFANAPKGPDGKKTLTWDDLGVVELPSLSGSSQTVMYESGYAIGKNSKNKDLAWKFIKFMTSYEVQKKYNSSGIAVCGRRDVALERSNEPLESEFLAIVPQCRAPHGARIEGYEFVENEGRNALDAVLQGIRTPQEALTRAAKRVDIQFAKK
ncbi:MAG TPA: sugar ABC transporter substrate-binding protein [Fimbriimonadaceae bacterium]|nr:sugar ABC transporter substrate-binding protein [Fimbriimonadaceae bacterium]